MLISKIGKQFMAFVIAIAFVLTGLTYAPKTANAEESAPSVKVLGATLRLDKAGDNIGTQSMRIGIEVSNADKAKSCAIKLTVGEKVRVIGTSSTAPDYAVGENTQYKQFTSLYSKDESSNKVVFTVTVTGIPQDAFASNIKVEGIAAGSDDATVKAPGVDKSVDGIVKEIKTKYPSLNIIMLGGILYTGNGEDKLASTDILDYNSSIGGNPDGIGWNADKTEYTIPLNEDTVKTIENADVSIVFDDDTVTCSSTKSYQGFGFYPPSQIMNRKFSKVTIEYLNSTGHFVHDIKYNSGDNDVGNPWGGNELISEETSYTHDLDSNRILEFVKFFNNQDTSSITFTKVTFTVVPEETSPSSEAGIDLSNTTSLYGKGDITKLTDGSSTGVVGKNVDGLRIPLGQEVNPGDSVSITVYGSATTGMRMWLADSDAKMWSAKQEPASFKNTYTFTADDKIDKESAESKETSAKYFLIKGPDANTSFETIIISKVVVKKLKNKNDIDHYDLNISTENWKKDYNGQNIGDLVYSNEEITIPFSDQAVILCNIPDEIDYRWTEITYKKTGGGVVEAYPIDLGQSGEKIELVTTDTYKTLYLPVSPEKSKCIKLFNVWGANTVTIKSIRLYKEDPSTGAPDI